MASGRPYTPLNPPLHLSVAYEYDAEVLGEKAVGELLEVKYSRENNPTVMELEAEMARLEGARWSLAFNTGMAAVAVVFLHALRQARGAVAIARLLYGSSRELAGLLLQDKLLVAGPPWDELLSLVESRRPALVFVESIGNPTLRVPPLDELGRLCSSLGCSLVVDNTMATPILLKPLSLGATLVVESLTKYVVGYNDAMGGLIAGLDPGLRAGLWRLRKLTGTILQAFEAYQAIRGLQTLKLRVERASQTALKVAKWLEDHPKVLRVYYPCLPSHPDHGNARRLLGRGCGGVVSFDLGSKEKALKLMKELKKVRPAPSFGLNRPVISYPYASSHRSLDEAEKKLLGITPGLLRLSVGLADAEEIIEELGELLSKL